METYQDLHIYYYFIKNFNFKNFFVYFLYFLYDINLNSIN